MEPTIRIQHVVDRQCPPDRIYVEQESPRYYVVSAARKIHPLDAIDAVTKHQEKQNGRDD